MILRLCDSAQRHASETLRGAFWNWNWEETRNTLTLQARHTLSSTLEASMRPCRFLCPVIRLVCYRSLLSEDIWGYDVRRLHLIGRIYLEFSNMNPIWNIENILRLDQFQIECRIGLKHTSLLHKMAYRIPLICSLGCSPAVCGKLCLIGASKTRGLAVGNCRILMNKELRTWWSTCASLEAASVAAFGFWLRMSEYSWFWVPMTAEGS